MDKPSLYTPNELSAFQTFTDFLNNLSDYMTDSKIAMPRSITRYHRLVSAVKFNQEKVFNRHISTLRDFCVANRDSFPALRFTTPTLRFSDLIFIEFPDLFNKVDSDTTMIVWEYLYSLSGLLDEHSLVKGTSPSGGETRVVDEQFNTLVGTDTNPLGMLGSLAGSQGGVNPMAMLGTMMNPDTMNDIMGTFNEEVESGNINLDELTSQVGTMMKQFEPIMSKLQSKLNLGDLNLNDINKQS